MQYGCPSCGRVLDGYFEKCPHCDYDLTGLHKLTDRYEKERTGRIKKYAGFMQRAVANQLDILIVSLVLSILVYFLSLIFKFSIGESMHDFILLFILAICFFYFFYCVFSHYSKNMATYGERIVGIFVVDSEGKPLSYVEAFTHNLYRILNVLTLGVGFLFIIFNKKKQALSDMISHTYVENVPIENDTLTYASVFSRLVAYIIDLLFIGAFGYALLFLVLPQCNLNYLFVKGIKILLIVGSFCYFAFMESKCGGTFGKLIMNIRVTNYDGEYISFWRSILRILVNEVELCIIFGNLVCLGNYRIQTVKDMITKTVVIQR